MEGRDLRKRLAQVPGTRITERQVYLYMKIRKKKSQQLAAAKAGINERQRYGNRRIRLDLLNGMRIAALTNVTDESRTMLLRNKIANYLFFHEHHPRE